MPTGYTSELYKGPQSFEDFTISCARAFGALVELRDDSTAPIPQEFKPNDYHKKESIKAHEALRVADIMTEKEAEAAARREYQEAMKGWYASRDKTEALKRRYESMQDEVRKWTPPTKDHKGLKDFMLEQLKSAIDFDCRTASFRDNPKMKSGKDFRSDKIALAIRDIQYHDCEYKKEAERCQERTQWVKDLRDSLDIKRETK